MAVSANPAGAPAGADRVWTIPNLLSFLRLLSVPLFLWLLLGPHADLWAILVLALSAATDYLDGWLARILDQRSRLGELLDPAVDRLFILATLVAFLLRGIVPWWLAAILLGRELVVGLCVLAVRRQGYPALPVHYLGKAATFALLYAFPLLLLGEGSGTAAAIARPIAYAFTIWGTALYVWAGVLYGVQTARLVRAARTPAGGSG